jgi:hypothetical protein
MPLAPKTRRRALILLAGLVLALVAAVGVAWHLSTRPPEWWHELPRDEPAVQAQAERVENGVVSELSRARPAEAQEPYRSGEWTLDITEAEANAWLGTRLRSWVQNRGGEWPRTVDAVQVSFRAGKIAIGVHLVEAGMDRVVSVVGMPEVREGAVWLRIDRMAVGGLALPKGVILDQFGSLVRWESTAKILDAVEGQRPVLDEAILELDGGRHVRITGVRAEAGRVVVTCRTEKESPQGP